MSANHIAQLTILGGNFPATWVILDGKTFMAEKKSKNLDKLKITARLPRGHQVSITYPTSEQEESVKLMSPVRLDSW